MRDKESALETLRMIDEFLLRSISGEEADAASWLNQRRAALERLLLAGPSLADVEELRERTRRLEERFLHLRRTTNMELSALDRHLRYLKEQMPPNSCGLPPHLNVQA